MPAYDTSKAGLAQMTKSLARAWAPDGVRVNAVAHGFIVTGAVLPVDGGYAAV